MNFYYRPVVSLSPETGEPGIILRPEITIRVCGATDSIPAFALVDSGADNTIFPLSVAAKLGIELSPGRGPPMTAFGGQSLAVWFGDVVMELSDGTERICWTTRIQFFDSASPADEAFILGHAGFLDFFTAIFNGENGVLTLTPNADLPVVPARPH